MDRNLDGQEITGEDRGILEIHHDLLRQAEQGEEHDREGGGLPIATEDEIEREQDRRQVEELDHEAVLRDAEEATGVRGGLERDERTDDADQDETDLEHDRMHQLRQAFRNWSTPEHQTGDEELHGCKGKQAWKAHLHDPPRSEDGEDEREKRGDDEEDVRYRRYPPKTSCGEQAQRDEDGTEDACQQPITHVAHASKPGSG